MNIYINHPRTNALVYGGAFGVLLGAISLISFVYLPNSFLSQIGMVATAPLLYASIYNKLIFALLVCIYLGVFFASYTSLLYSMKNKVNRWTSGLVILGSMLVLHTIFAKLFMVGVFEALSSDIVTETVARIIYENSSK